MLLAVVGPFHIARYYNYLKRSDVDSSGDIGDLVVFANVDGISVNIPRSVGQEHL